MFNFMVSNFNGLTVVWSVLCSIGKSFFSTRSVSTICVPMYIFYSIFKGHFFVFKEFFQKFLSLFMACIQERLMMTLIWYITINRAVWGYKNHIHRYFLIISYLYLRTASLSSFLLGFQNKATSWKLVFNFVSIMLDVGL